MKAKGLAWLGTRTSKFDAMVALCRDVMGLEVVRQEPGFTVMDSPYNPFFSGPVAGFLADDIHAARPEMESCSIEFIGPIETTDDGNAWNHFRAPDGFIFELIHDPKRSAE